jgi:CheY-like chemotaxis protein
VGRPGEEVSTAARSTVLLVEDEPTVRSLVAECLGDEGYAVVQVSDGAAAVRALNRYRPPPPQLSLVLLDMMLPHVSGLGVLQHLGALDSYVPVVAMSASRPHLAAATAAGAQAVLAKPFEVERLLDLVEHCAWSLQPQPSRTRSETLGQLATTADALDAELEDLDAFLHRLP